MQIAISGTHFIGKSTMIEDFIKKHPNYSYEMEPYYQLQNQGVEEFSEALTLECVLRQLDYSIELLNSRKNLGNIIFDRSPIDFIAYAMHIADRLQIDLNDTVFSEKFPEIKESLQGLDLIVFLPITKEHSIGYQEEDATYRKIVDKNFKRIYRDEIYDVFPGYNHPKIIEIWGNPLTRIKKLESYLIGGIT